MSDYIHTILRRWQVAPRLFNVSYRRVGGLTFVRFGRLSMSFCLTMKPVAE